MSWVEISESIFLFRDTCNVYCIRRGSKAILIDAGSGAVFGGGGDLYATAFQELVPSIHIVHDQAHHDRLVGRGAVSSFGRIHQPNRGL